MQKSEPKAIFDVEGIGGIEETSVGLSPGVTILMGRNATNRTSFMQAIKAAMGSRNVSIKGDVDEATIRLKMDEDDWERTLKPEGSSIVASGDTYFDDPDVAELFAFLLGGNEARRAVSQNRDLHDIIMKPIDTEQIEREIQRLLEEQSELDTRLDGIDELKQDLPELEQERQQIESEMQTKRDDLRSLEAEIDDTEADVDETREDKAELEEKFSELRKIRNDLEEVRYDIDTQKESIQSLKTDRAELQSELEDLDEVPDDRPGELSSRIEELRTEKQRLQTQTNDLRSVLQFNQELLAGEENTAVNLLRSDDGTAVTDHLLDESGTVNCWTCGSTVQREQIEETLEELRSIHQEKRGEISEIEAQIEELRDEHQELETQVQRRKELEQDLAKTESEIERREGRLEELTDEREELSKSVEELEADVETLESEDFSDVLELHKEANQLEFEIEQREKTLASLEEEIQEIETRLEEEEDLKVEREEITSRLSNLRNRIERIEQQAVEEFNTHMDAILTRLEYDNIERIWIETVQKEIREGRRKVERSLFELHVVRTTVNGATYEDTVDHLSESEREVTGLVFALAGYLVHDLHEDVPFMLLDSLESIDADRISTLVDYFREYAEYLVVALLPEDAQAIDDSYQRVTQI